MNRSLLLYLLMPPKAKKEAAKATATPAKVEAKAAAEPKKAAKAEAAAKKAEPTPKVEATPAPAAAATPAKTAAKKEAATPAPSKAAAKKGDTGKSPQEQANALKEKAGRAYQNRNWVEARDLYSQAIELDPTNHTVCYYIIIISHHIH
jgi:cytoskeletal protein RodZ